MPQKRPSSYIPGLDGIRAVAFLLVFFAHGGVPYVPATLGVTIFFFLSGFLITTLLRKEYEKTGTISFRDFYIRRAVRILVPLYIVYGIATLIGKFYLNFTGTLSAFISSVFYYFNYGYCLYMAGIDLNTAGPPGMSVIWSLCIEEHFYFLFPVVFLFLMRSKLSKRARMSWLVGFCMLELAWRIVRIAFHFRGGPDWNYYATDTRLDSILWGAVLAMFANPALGDRLILPRRYAAALFGLAVFALGAMLEIQNLAYQQSVRYTVQALLMGVIFTFVISQPDHWSVRWLEWTPVRYIGWTSYVLYLCHFLIDSVVSAKMHLSKPVRLLVCFCIAIAFATLMRYTVELPLQRLRGRFRRVPERDTTAADGHGLIS